MAIVTTHMEIVTPRPDGTLDVLGYDECGDMMHDLMALLQDLRSDPSYSGPPVDWIVAFNPGAEADRAAEEGLEDEEVEKILERDPRPDECSDPKVVMETLNALRAVIRSRDLPEARRQWTRYHADLPYDRAKSAAEIESLIDAWIGVCEKALSRGALVVVREYM